MKRIYLDRLGASYFGSSRQYRGFSFPYRLRGWFQEFKYRYRKRKYGFETREIWNTDMEFFYWVYERVSLFLDNHGCVDLEDADTFSYEGHNLKETLETLQSVVKEYITAEDYPDCDTCHYRMLEDGSTEPTDDVCKETYLKKLGDLTKRKQELYGKAFDIFRQALPYMWW